MIYRYFSTDHDSPVLSEEGSLLNLFKKCLVEGYNQTLANSIAYFDVNTISVTFSTPHNYNIGQWVRISMAAVIDYNGLWKIKNIPDSTTIHLETNAIISQSTPTDSTESISVIVAPVGFELSFDSPSTSEAVFRKLNTTELPSQTSKYVSLYVNDKLPVPYNDVGIYASVNISPEFEYITPQGLHTTNRSYQSNARIVYNVGSTLNYNSVDLVDKEWILIADIDNFNETVAVYLMIKPHSSSEFMVYAFGIFNSYKFDDINSIFSMFSDNGSYFDRQQLNSTNYFNTGSKLVLHKDVSGLIPERANLLSSMSAFQDNIGSSGVLLNPANLGTVYFKPTIYGEVSNIRGTLPCILTPSANIITTNTYAFNTNGVEVLNVRYMNGTVGFELHDIGIPIPDVVGGSNQWVTLL